MPVLIIGRNMMHEAPEGIPEVSPEDRISSCQWPLDPEGVLGGSRGVPEGSPEAPEGVPNAALCPSAKGFPHRQHLLSEEVRGRAFPLLTGQTAG